MATILDKFAAYKRDEVKAAKAIMSMASLDLHAKAQRPPRGFHKALQKNMRLDNGR